MRAVPIVCGLGLVVACSKEPAPPSVAEWTSAPAPRIAVPGGKTPQPTPRPLARSLAADEGSLEVLAPPRTPIGSDTTARIRVTPGKGFHINTEYPFVLSLTNAAGVRLEKTRLTGGKFGEPGDADKLVDAELSIPIALQPLAAGDHTLRGTISFGICRSDVCLTREEPIVLPVSGCDTAAC